MQRTATLVSAVLLSFLGGVLVMSYFHIALIGVGFLCIGMLYFGMMFIGVRGAKRRANASFLSVIILGLAFGMLRTSLREFAVSDADLEQALGKNIIAEGVVVRDPDQRLLSTQYHVRLDHIQTAEGVRNVSGSALVIADRYPEVGYGDNIILRGVIVHPKNFTPKNSEGTEVRPFDYVSYLAKDDIHYQFFRPDIRVLKRGEGNQVMEFLLSIKKRLLTGIRRVLPEPQSGLLAGLLLGEKSGLSSELVGQFKASGIVHIVVLSGYNITLVAEGMFLLFGRIFARRFAFGLSLLGIILFTVMAGAGATAVRATMMAFLVLVGRETGRTSDMVRILLFVAGVMVLVNPTILLSDPSFQLSFLATLGLLLLSGPIEKWLSRFWTKWFVLRSIFSATLATQVTVLPLLLYQTGMFAVYALPANMLVLPLIPMTMIMGFVTGLVSIGSTAIAYVFAGMVYVPLWWIVAVAGAIARLPYATLALPLFPSWVLVAVYGGAVLWWGYRWNQRRKDQVSLFERFPVPILEQESIRSSDASFRPPLTLVAESTDHVTADAPSFLPSVVHYPKKVSQKKSKKKKRKTR